MLDRPEVILSAAEGRHSKNKSFAKELRSKKKKNHRNQVTSYAKSYYYGLYDVASHVFCNKCKHTYIK